MDLLTSGLKRRQTSESRVQYAVTRRFRLQHRLVVHGRSVIGFAVAVALVKGRSTQVQFSIAVVLGLP